METTIDSRTPTPTDQIDNKDGDANTTATANRPPTASVDHNFGGVNEIIEIMEEDEEIFMSSSPTNQYKHNNNDNDSNHNKSMSMGKSGGKQLVPISEGGGIEETNTTSLFSIDIHNENSDVVYVAVGKSESSMDALQWTLNHSVNPGSTLVYLIHIFSGLKYIPSPLGGGMVPKTQVSPDLVERYVAQDSRKRRELLTKYVDKCTSHMVQVETILIESDSVANSIVELISVLNIRHLVLGISKSNLRRVKAGKGSATVAEQIRQRAGEGCELKIVCQGNQINVSELYFRQNSQSPSPTSSLTAASRRSQSLSEFDDNQLQPTSNNSFSCCFKA